MPDGLIVFLSRIKIQRVDDPVFDIMAGGSADEQAGMALDREDPGFGHEDRWSDLADRAAAPAGLRVTVDQFFPGCRADVFIDPAVDQPGVMDAGQPVVVFMVARDEDRGEGLFVQPVQGVSFGGRFDRVCIPYAAEVAADNDNIIFCHVFLVREVFRVQSWYETIHGMCSEGVCSVGVSSDVDRHKDDSPFW